MEFQQYGIDGLVCPALVNKGNVMFARNDFEKAREYFKEALSNDSSCVEAMYNLGKHSCEFVNVHVHVCVCVCACVCVCVCVCECMCVCKCVCKYVCV